MILPATAEAAGFLKIPLPVPPMLESAFRYRASEQYVALGFGAQGGRLSDFIGDSPGPKSPSLATDFLLHPSVKPYADAFRIETAPPEWVSTMKIEEADRCIEQFESWGSHARCLLLDRAARQFFVGAVNSVRSWLILRTITDRRRCPPAPRGVAGLAEKELWAWLDSHPSRPIPVELLKGWEATFQKKQAVSACFGAGLRLGFDADTLVDMMCEAFE